MANPQKENGYTAIANEILEALINNQFSGQELRVILLIIRKTYGYHKKMDFVSLSQIAEAIKSSKIRCSQVVRKLELMKILTVNENINGIGKSYIFNKDFEKWKGVNENINGISKYKRGVNENIKGGVNENINHKRKNINIQLKKRYVDDSIEIKLSEYFYQKILTINQKHKKPNMQSWAEHIALMIRIDKRNPEEIKKLIDWLYDKNSKDKDAIFWRGNIISTKKLRIKYDQLMIIKTKSRKQKHHFSQGAIDYMKKEGLFDEQK